METIAALYNDYEDARSAVNDLLAAGVSMDEISLIAGNAGGNLATGTLAGAGEGAVIGGLTGFAAGVAALMIPGIGPILAIGPLAATLTGIGWGAAAGGAIGALTEIGLPHESAGAFAEGVRRGGTLVIAHAEADQVDAAKEALNRHNPVDMDVRETGEYISGGFPEIQMPIVGPMMVGNTTLGVPSPANIGGLLHAGDPDLYTDEDPLLGEPTANYELAASSRG